MWEVGGEIQVFGKGREGGGREGKEGGKKLKLTWTCEKKAN
jgi:hypothetical protein